MNNAKHNSRIVKKSHTSKQEPQAGLGEKCMLGNMHKMAAPSELHTGSRLT